MIKYIILVGLSRVEFVVVGLPVIVRGCGDADHASARGREVGCARDAVGFVGSGVLDGKA